MAQGPLAVAGSSKQVAIIGGGCAGLAAAARLAEAGIRTTIYEAGKQAGGRARGLDWQGQRLDNGQHILLGAYKETLDLMGLAGIDAKEAFLRLPLHLQIHGQFELRTCERLPAPLHILVGVLQASGLSFKDRLAIAKFMSWMRWANFKLAKDESLQELLQRKQQPANVIRLLWEPLCLAALNTPPSCASAQVFLNVLRDSFTGAKANSDLLLPRRDLSALFADPVSDYVQSKSGMLNFGTAVSRIALSDNGFQLETSGTEKISFSHIVVAVSPFRAANLLKPFPELAETAAACANFDYQPIYTVYLQYAAHLQLPDPMIGLAHNGHCQWLFDRGRLNRQHGLIAAVISAEGPHQRLTQQELAAAATSEIKHAFPEFASPLWHKVIAEKRATFACTHNLPRPGQRTAISGLYLAGDYTAGDYPATIEGAVRSGTSCARYIIEELLAA